MADGDTPKKVRLGRKPKAENPNDYCRCCKVWFKVRYGDSWRSISSENLFLPSNKKGLEGTMLSDALQKTGILAEKKACLSNRVCLPCATKIRKTTSGFNFIVSTLNVVNPKFVQSTDPEVKVIVPRAIKRLPASVPTPERSPELRKKLKTGQISAKEKISNARESLGSQFCTRVTENDNSILNNYDVMSSSEQSTRVKVVELSLFLPYTYPPPLNPGACSQANEL